MYNGCIRESLQSETKVHCPLTELAGPWRERGATAPKSKNQAQRGQVYKSWILVTPGQKYKKEEAHLIYYTFLAC